MLTGEQVLEKKENADSKENINNIDAVDGRTQAKQNEQLKRENVKIKEKMTPIQRGILIGILIVALIATVVAVGRAIISILS